MTLLLDAKEKIPTHSLNDAVLESKIYMTKVFRKSVLLSWYMLYNETYYLQKNAERRFTRQKALMTVYNVSDMRYTPKNRLGGTE
ncbi:MAG: hypothetical protein HFH12_12270 [Dorea sp.]|nr:hypothetical protein [Dorea sp.]